jgi:hypothetical protein
MMAINPDDPTTWPEDADALAELAKGFPDDAETAPEAAETPAVAEPVAEPVAETPEAPAEAQEPAAEVPEAPILTADGKHYIPHSVLKEARERAVQAEAQIKAQQEQFQTLMAQLQAQPQPQAPAPVQEAAPSLWDTPIALTETEQARVEQVRKDWGDDQAETLQQSYLALKRTEVQDQILRAQHQQMTQYQQQMAELQAALSQQSQQSQQAESEQIQAAIDQSPLLTAWQADNQSPYFDYSVKLHEYLMTTDPVYAKLGWSERMAMLPAKVEALHGASPHAQHVGAVTPTAPVAKGPARKATPDIPLSHSDIVAGGTPPSANEVERIDKMSPVQLQQHLASMPLEDLRGYLTQF